MKTEVAMHPVPQKQPIEPDRSDDAGAQEPPERDPASVDRRHRDTADAGIGEPDGARPLGRLPDAPRA
jgi:hypothetical protein